MPTADQTNSPPPSAGQHTLAAAIVAFALLTLFGPMLLADRLPAMRDAGHYYYPLFKWCAGEWRAGRAPLWNPHENGGTSLCADPTASLWYPGKLVFALPIDYSVCYKLYIGGHVVLCAAAAYWLAWRWGASPCASGLAALAYSCGGSVLFQHCNVIYLVSAAWLPVAIGLLDFALREGRWRAAIGLGVVLALMILGGDPQMAYHVLLLGGLYLLVLVSGRYKSPAGSRVALRMRLALLTTSAVVAFLLAAIQILPSAEAAAISEREQSTATLFAPPQPRTHQAAAFDYSVGPWRFAELVWPNCGGRMYPTHRRWFSLLPDESRIWTPSLYMGLVPLVLGLSMFSLRAADVRTRWLSWLVLIFVLGSFGTFGLGWLARQAYQLSGGNAASFPLGDGVGGVYWLLTVLLPKYAMFRYPAKLFVVGALAISVLAAIGWDRALGTRRMRPERVLWVLSLASWIAALAALAATQMLTIGETEVDAAFGPFDSRGAWRDILLSLLHTSIVAWIAAWLFQKYTTWRGPTLLLLCAAELSFANYWLVPTAPADLWREACSVANVENLQRIFRAPRWWPAEFAARGSPDRLTEIVRWERQTLAGRYALLDGVPLVNTAPRPLASAEYERLLDQAASGPGGQLDEAALRRLGVELLILSAHANPPFAERVADSGLPTGAALFRMKPAEATETGPIEHKFDPWSFRVGAIISAIAWISLAVAAVALWRSRGNPPLKSSSSAPA